MHKTRAQGVSVAGNTDARRRVHDHTESHDDVHISSDVARQRNVFAIPPALGLRSPPRNPLELLASEKHFNAASSPSHQRMAVRQPSSMKLEPITNYSPEIARRKLDAAAMANPALNALPSLPRRLTSPHHVPSLPTDDFLASLSKLPPVGDTLRQRAVQEGIQKTIASSSPTKKRKTVDDIDIRPSPTSSPIPSHPRSVWDAPPATLAAHNPDSPSATIDNHEESPAAKRRKVRQAPYADEREASEDPFEFIRAVRGKQDSLEFVYMMPVNRGPHNPHYNPYHLKIVPHSEIDPNDFYTLSAKGVTHIVRGVAEFTELDQWIREHDLYHKVMRIPLFRRYRMWKAFTVWHKNVRAAKIAEKSRKLKGRLFILNNTLQEAIRNVKDICIEMSKLRLHRIDDLTTYTIGEFSRLQEEHRAAVVRQLTAHVARIREVVKTACETSLEAAGFGLDDMPKNVAANAAGGFALSTSTSLGPSVTFASDVADVDPPSKPAVLPGGRRFSTIVEGTMRNPTDKTLSIIAAASTYHPLRYTEQAAKRSECRRLSNFIKLADYLIVDTLHGMAMSSANDILQKMRTITTATAAMAPTPYVPGTNAPTQPVAMAAKFALTDVATSVLSLLKAKRDQPLFRVQLLLIDDHLSFSPNADELLRHVDGMFEGFIDAVTSIEKLIVHPDFKQFTQPVLHDGIGTGPSSDGSAMDNQPNGHGDSSTAAARLVELDPAFTGDGLDLRAIITNDDKYAKVVTAIKETLSQAFKKAEEFSAIFEPFQRMHLENRVMDIHRVPEAELTLKFFIEAITKYKSQSAAVDGMATLAQVGIYLVDSTVLRDTIAPSPIRCLREIERFLPELARAKNEALLGELTNATRMLSARPHTVDEFVEYLAFHRDIKARSEELKAKFDAVNEMYEMMKQYGVRVPDEDNALYQTLAPAFHGLRETIDASESNRDEKMNRFVFELGKEIAKLRSAIVDLKHKAQHPMISNPEFDGKEVLEYISHQLARAEELRAQANKFTRFQEMFSVPVARYDDLDEHCADLQLKHTLWASLADWTALTRQWAASPLSAINADDISAKVNHFTKLVYQVERGLPYNKAVPKLRQLVYEFKAVLPVVLDLINPALQARHWERIQSVIQQRIVRDQNFTLGALLEMRVLEHKEAIAAISAEATNELALIEMLKKVEATWAALEFTVVPHKDSKDQYILVDIDDIIARIEDSQVSVATIKSSPHLGPIKNVVMEWDHQISLLAETLEEWIACQRDWLYLESIFSAADIQRQLPTEYKMFLTVDKAWKDLMTRTRYNPNALKAATAPGVLEILKKNNIEMAKIQKSLEDYLETKRLAFPRFYFLSNNDLLEILAQSRNVRAVQPHLRKCFDNIVELEFTPEPKSISICAMISGERERVPFIKTVKAWGSVENWLGGVEAQMMASLRKITKDAVFEYKKKSRTEWLMEFPAQVVLTVGQIFWCRAVTKALNAGASGGNPLQELTACRDQWVRQLEDLVNLVRGELTEVKRAVVTSLITVDVHLRDIVDSLIKAGVTSDSDFTWTKQLRYYWKSEISDCEVRQTNATFLYGYEYLGCTPRLVLTPLTDKCYITLTGALHLHLGGAPAGPAGTGKTETVKDLAKAMGKQCVVFNCSDGLDYKMMGKFFSGLAQSGAWCCFDEFNRIDVEVLSVIAQQLFTIKNALSANASKFVFEGAEIRLNPTCGFFVTMNPGYAGRTELPDNLKALFRPVAMMIPDYALIAEIILYSEGFQSAQLMSRKMVQLYNLSSQQLSQQDHYDFGMRAVKSVLVMAGALKRANPELPENVVLIRALRDSNVPKFLAQDAPLFAGILSDLFPGVELPEHDYGQLQRAIEHSLNAAGKQVVASQVAKVIQLYETMVVRHGVMLVGPTGGGKSTVLTTLAAALGRLFTELGPAGHYRPVKMRVVNPKCVSRNELYGAFNPITHEWNGGLVALIVRDFATDTSEDGKWVVFDGPVDALWVEDMNTVLDDNKLLCLANGQRIKLDRTIRMVFEVEDLRVASPATVSRCGMVYLDPALLGWRPAARTWVDTQISPKTPKGVRDRLWQLLDGHVDAGLAYLRKECAGHEYVPSTDNQQVAALCSLFGALWREDRGVVFEDTETELKRLADMLFVFCYVWGIGGNLDAGAQDGFDSFVRGEFESVVAIPGARSVYYYYVDIAEKAFKSWVDAVPPFRYVRGMPYFQMIVPTADTLRFAYIVDALLRAGKPVLLNGETGVGKSVIVGELLNKLSDSAACSSIIFTAQSSSPQTQDNIENAMEKKRKNLLGPPAPKDRVILFFDDVNMPQPEPFGAQPPIELLRQMLDYGGFYDRKKLFWKELQSVNLVAACAPPGGGRNPLPRRFTRHFHLLCIQPPSESTLKHIFSSILDGFLEKFPPEVSQLSKKIVNASVEVYTRMCKEMLPRPAKSHYTFNLRDLSKVFQGILQTKPSAVPNATTAVRLWIHECLRVFHDRLIDKNDKRYFTEMLIELLRRLLDINWTHESVFENAPMPIMFGDFMRIGAAASERVYEEITDPKKLVRTLETYLEGYNIKVTSSQTEMQLDFFMDAVEHIARISRIIRQPRGSALLVGVGGSGKRSLTRLACHMSDYMCYELGTDRPPKISGSGGGGGAASSSKKGDFREDLKALYHVAGVAGQPVVFLISEDQITSETILEDVNNILNSGEVPNLFDIDEHEKVISDVRPHAKAAGIPDQRDLIYKHFVYRVRENLHIVLCLSPVGDKFRNWCRKFPSLVNCCTIDWFDRWPREALFSVAKKFLSSDSTLSQEESPALIEKLAEMSVEIHLSVQDAAERLYAEHRRRWYLTPTTYLTFTSQFVKMLAERRREFSLSREKLHKGLESLRQTNELVSDMQRQLSELQPKLQEKARSTEELLEVIKKDQETADGVKRVVIEEEREIKEKTVRIEAMANEAKRDLDEALPALELAIKALNSLNKSDISEVKSFTNPPEMVVTVMEAVCHLLQERADWPTARSLLNDPGFLHNLINFDKDNIPDAVLRKIKKYTENPSFEPAVVAKHSVAAKSLCMWVRAIEVYSKVYRNVQPRKLKVAEATALLEESKGKLAEKQRKLAEVEAQLEYLRRQYETNLAEKTLLAAKIEDTTKRLRRASMLTAGLSDEAVRWSATLEELERSAGDIVGNTFLGAACVTYIGPFTRPFREELVAGWVAGCRSRGIQVSSDFTLIGKLSDPVKVRDWSIYSLPTDDHSVENGILVTAAADRWPLMIDPQGQANRWIRGMEERNGLRVVRLTDPNFVRTLEGNIRIGTPVLLEDVGETLDPVLEPILLKKTFRTAGRLRIRLGEVDIDYDPNFRFYITTKLANPHFLPDVCTKVNIVNFTVTAQGLEEQLLSDVVAREKAEIEEKRTDLIVRMAEDRRQLRDIEDKILRLLYMAEGHLLDDEVLINTLNESKATSNMLVTRLHEAEETQRKINTLRDAYRPVAVRGSILYFAVAELANVDSMYQFSLGAFSKLFNRCLVRAKPHPDLATRLDILIRKITRAVYRHVSMGLFERHKLAFSFSITVAILRQSGKITGEEWNVFVRGATLLSKQQLAAAVPVPSELADIGITPAVAEQLVAMETILPDVFGGIRKHIASNNHAWRALLTSSEPHRMPLPWQRSAGKASTSTTATTGGTELSGFQKLLLIKALREDKLEAAVIDFVDTQLGHEYVERRTFDLEEIYQKTQPNTPVIFILSPGADPSDYIVKFARERGRYERLHVVSLGQGQGPVATAMINRAIRAGDWVLLQNCHLAKSWMPQLEKIVASFATATTMEPPPKDSANAQLAATEGTTPGSSSVNATVATAQPSGMQLAGAQELHREFRLFLTSQPCDWFPVPVLQNGVKITTEPPKGLRANLKQSFSEISENQFEEGVAGGAANTRVWKRLLFGLCFFHAAIQERKRFGALGWNIRYEFSQSDLSVAMETLRMLLTGDAAAAAHVPWRALRYLTGEVLYGGRVTDEWDVRCLRAILDRYYSPHILSDSYTFSPSGLYRPPPPTGAGSALDDSLKNYRAYIDQLPFTEKPEVFGLHDNAELTFQLQEAKRLLSAVHTLQPQIATTTNAANGDAGDATAPTAVVTKTPEEIVRELAVDILERLPQPMNVEEAHPSVAEATVGGRPSPLTTVLFQEIQRFNRLLGIVRSSLGQLLAAIKGEIVMTRDLEQMFGSIANNQVPALWRAAAYPSLKPLGPWTRDLHARVAFFSDWLANGQPRAFWLSGFFFPHGFLTAVLQLHARKYNIPVDSTHFTFRVLDVFEPREVEEPPEDGVYVYGLYLDGARWDSEARVLEDSLPGVMYSKCPIIHFLPVEKTEEHQSAAGASTEAQEGSYVCPVYKTAERAGTLSTTGHSTNFITAVVLPSKKPQDFWILRGAAALCQLNE